MMPTSKMVYTNFPSGRVRVLARVKFGLVYNCVFLIIIVSKSVFNVDAVQKRQNGKGRQCDNLLFTGDVEAYLERFLGCHTDGLSVSGYGVFIIHIWNLETLNVQKIALFDPKFIEVKPQLLRLHGK